MLAVVEVEGVGEGVGVGWGMLKPGLAAKPAGLFFCMSWAYLSRSGFCLTILEACLIMSGDIMLII